ncbi:MAG: hypothetical protein Kow0098_21100 [Ignavibacteriaceae bacterium]
MNIFDLIILIAAAGGFILGFKDGFVRKLIGIIGFVAAVFFSFKFASELGQFIESNLNIEFYLAELIAGMLIFLLVIFLFAVIKRVVHPFDRVNNLINRIVGGVVGVIQILFFISAVFLILKVFDIPDKNTSRQSLLYEKTYQIIPLTIEYLSDYTPDTKKIIREYIEEQDSAG